MKFMIIAGVIIFTIFVFAFMFSVAKINAQYEEYEEMEYYLKKEKENNKKIKSFALGGNN